MAKPLIVIDGSGSALDDSARALVKSRAGSRLCWIGPAKPPKGFSAGATDNVVYHGDLKEAFTEHESIQDHVESWLADAETLTLWGDGYGAFITALGAFYRKLPTVYIAPAEAHASPYFPLVAAVVDLTRLPGATRHDERLKVLKGKHLKGRLEKT